MDHASRVEPDKRRIVLVGPCAAGKSTLANRLRSSGHDVRICGQEHSAIRDLWRRLEPDVLIALEVDLPTVRSRRSPYWPEQLYATQRTRLASAFAAADVVIDSAANDADQVEERALGWLRKHQTPRPYGRRLRS